MKFEVLILGSSSATPMHGRNPTSQLVNLHDHLMLVDCGEGTQLRLSKFGVKINKIKYIFISHLHGDHYLGLMGLLSSMHLMGRKTPLQVYGPVGLREIVEIQLHYSQTQISYPLHFQVTDPDSPQTLLETNDLMVSSFPLDHRVPCTGFRFDEKPAQPGLIAEKVEALGVPKGFYKLLKKGVDFVAKDGTVYPWQTLTTPPPAARSYAFCSDTVASGGYLEAVAGVDLLYHESTFLHEMLDRALLTYHTTALQAGEIARSVGARKLLIGHYSARYRELQPLLNEAKSVFPATELALEGSWYSV